MQQCGSDNGLTDAESRLKYASEETADFVVSPELVLSPTTATEVALILTYCNAKKIAVTPQGARTGLSGGALPLFGGIALSMERFNKIIEIDENNGQVTVEPAVITQVLQQAVAEKNLFYPPD